MSDIIEHNVNDIIVSQITLVDVIEIQETVEVGVGGAVDYVDQSARDSINSNLIYIGRSNSILSDTSVAEWRIYRYDSEAGTIVLIYADGNQNFDNVWDNRESLIYS